ncbi:4Fe-4S dicluster domain-containing protein [Desulfobaculum sp. SPO524]|uniref:4Fe-4S dicluster domain-containing protein n=1 Tax=Desulfobaculum sp. SPO524 TaxID=3378071 RepID=UPI003853E7E3
MKKYDLSLNPLPGGIHEMPVPGELNIPVKGMLLKAARGKSIAQGTLVAQCAEAGCGDMHAPVAGKVSKVSYAFVTLKPADEPETVEPVDLAAITDAKERLRALRGLGIDTRRYAAAEHLIINAMDPEPEVGVATALLDAEAQTVRAGVDYAKLLVGAVKTTVVAADSAASVSFDGAQTVRAPGVYPASVDPLVAKAATGKENPAGVCVIDVAALWQLGRVVETGLPVAETVLTAGGKHWRVRIGTPVQAVLEAAGLEVHAGDVVRLGGPMRGAAAFSTDQGIGRDCRAVGIVPAGSAAPVEDRPCINCGECVQHCPARLQPNMLTRYAEYDMFEKAAASGLGVCFECGLCAMHCMARRPMLHMLRFAKEQLRLSREG